MNKKKRLYLILSGLLFLLLVFSTVSLWFSRERKQTSLFHPPLSAYLSGREEWIPPAASYDEGSAESLFLLGMDDFLAENYSEAQSRFEEALHSPSSDPAIKGCLYFLISQCETLLKGGGDPDTVTMAFEAMRLYSPLANDTAFLGPLLSSISLSSASDSTAIALMQKHLEEIGQLDLHTWAWLNNYIAVLEYNGKAYARSIRLFYDISSTLNNVKMTAELEIQKRFAKEYLANIYYIFEDYENAGKLYQELLDSSPIEGYFHSYGCYINLANVYLKQQDFDQASASVEALKEKLPHISPALQAEIEAIINYLLAKIAIEKGNYDEASSCLDLAENYYHNHSGGAIMGGGHYVALTRCKYLLSTGKMDFARDGLESLISTGDASYYHTEQEIFELLKEIYEITDQEEKLIATYQKLLDVNKEHMQTIRREYLEFSEFYQENTHLKERNMNLSRTNKVSFVFLLLITLALIALIIFLRQLGNQNMTDQLTGAYNRKKLNRLIHNYKRSKLPGRLAVIMMDIDYFKRYNDTYGHPAGDQVLKQAAQLLMSSLRSKDLVIRYGGEEFLVILNDIDSQTAQSICQRIRQQLKLHAIPHCASEAAEYVTMSMGLCHQSSSTCTSLEEMIQYADECLYLSKEGGRNQFSSKLL